MNLYKKIDYSKMLLETMRAYHSVNAAGQLSYMYKFALCCLYPLQQPFDNFDAWRKRILLIANCKWQIGQLTNVLNMLYDPILERISISQAETVGIFVPNIDEDESSYFAPNIDEGESEIMVPNIDDAVISSNTVTFHVPALIYTNTALLSQLIADIEMIKLKGILYTIVSI